MDDDLNTADAISVLFKMARDINTMLDKGETEGAGKSLELLNELGGVLGLLEKEDEGEKPDEEVEKLIAERQEARKNKDFARADEIRDILKDMGIVLEDTREGVKWSRM